MTVKFEVLSCQRGDIQIDHNDDDEEGRKKLGKEIKKILANGFLVTLGKGKTARRIIGYDEKKNEWILQEGKERSSAPARDTTATVVAPIAAG